MILNLKKIFKLLLGLLIGLAIIYYTFKDADIDVIYNYVIEIDIIYFILALVFFGLDIFFRIYRWHKLLNIDTEVTRKFSSNSFFIGVGLNNIMPFKLGEFVKIMYLNLHLNISNIYLLALVYFERLSDLIALAIISTAAFVMSSFIAVEWIWYSYLAVLVISFCLTILLLLFYKYESIPFQGRVVDKINNIFKKLNSSFNIINNKNTVVMSIFYSSVAWITLSIFFFFLVKSFNVSISLSDAVIIIVIVSVGILVPTTPGAVGLFEFIIVKSLVLLGLEYNLALVIAIIAHFIMFVPIMIVGVYIMLKKETKIQNIIRLKFEK